MKSIAATLRQTSVRPNKTNKNKEKITKTAIVYYSRHHRNTEKLLKAIADKHPDVDLFDISDNPPADLSAYDRIGFASGIYYSKFQKSLLQFAKDKIPDGKQTFFIYTYGQQKKGYTKAIAEAVAPHNAEVLGEYCCFGFNTYGPFKLFGGMAKGHPDVDEIAAAVKFYEELK